mmetsp:Transcript_15024/g.49851  ORF Transcript_15024/g.49851 Transcript_15024/m.49851 type:complete len:145 (+) Transcript_15024:2-436(+)
MLARRAAATWLRAGPSLASAAGPAAGLALWKSAAVSQWAEKQPGERHGRPTAVETSDGEIVTRTPSRRKQALKVKAAIRAGEILLEPTVMVEPPRFKGHKRDRSRPARQAQIEQKMKEMPALIEEYRVERRERREKRRQEERFK